MINFNIRLKTLRTDAGLSQQDLAIKIGLSKSSVNMYERGEREPSLETLEAIADFFNVDIDYLLGKTDVRNRYASAIAANNVFPMPKLRKLPRLGTIACGEPILAEENIEDYDSVPENIKADFTLKCKGDSMINARILDGDIVYIRQQPDVESGEIAAILIGNEATLKRVYKYENKIVLQPENPKYEPLVFVDEELNQIRIIGKAVSFTSMIK